MNKLIEYLKQNVAITDAIQEKLNKITFEKEIAKGENILSENSIKKQHIFVLDGCLRSFYRMKNGKEVTLQFAIKNWWIGDYITLYTEEKSILSVEAVTKSKILLIDKLAIEQLYLAYPEFETFQRKNLERRLATLQKRILNLLALTAVEKYDKFISEYAEFAQIIPNYQIASYLGITPESLSRVRKRKINKS